MKSKSNQKLSGADAASTSTEDRLVAAALERFKIFGIQKTSMAEIAMEAGLSKVTAYRYFNNKVEIAEEAALRGIAAINAAVAKRIARIDSFSEQIIEAMATSIETVLGDEYLRSLLTSDPGNLMTELTENSPKLAELEQERWAPILYPAIAAGEIRKDLSVKEVMGWLLLVEVALIRQAETPANKRKPAELRRYLRTFVLQGLTPSH